MMALAKPERVGQVDRAGTGEPGRQFEPLCVVLTKAGLDDRIAAVRVVTMAERDRSRRAIEVHDAFLIIVVYRRNRAISHHRHRDVQHVCLAAFLVRWPDVPDLRRTYCGLVPKPLLLLFASSTSMFDTFRI